MRATPPKARARGYRIYLGKGGAPLIILLGSGTKKWQQKDIEAAKSLWKEYKQAACLGAVKGGLDGKTKIAIETKQDLKTVAQALEKLSRARLIKRAGTRR